MQALLLVAVSTLVLDYNYYSYANTGKLLMEAVQAAIQDKGFSIPSVPATASLAIARKVYAWMMNADNEATLSTFAECLCASLNDSIERVTPKHHKGKWKLERDSMHGIYHQLRTSKEFRLMWGEFFMLSTGEKGPPILYQYLTDHIFKQLVETNFPLEQEERSSSQALSDIERKALRYAAGYVERALTKQIRKSSHPLKVDMLAALSDFTNDDHTSDDEDDHSTSWIKRIDRGGLTHISNSAYHFFAALEEGISKVTVKPGANLRPNWSIILESEDVQFYWALLSSEWDTEIRTELFDKVVSLWVTIRGYSKCSAWVERYKAETKTALQKSKGLRKKCLVEQNI